MLQLAPFSLPGHPATLGLVILPGTEQQVKRTDAFPSMALVERPDVVDELSRNFIIDGHMFGWRICEISKQRNLKMSVTVGKPVSFDLTDEICDLAGLPDQHRHHRNRFAVCGKPV